MTELLLTYIAMGQYQEARDYLCDEWVVCGLLIRSGESCNQPHDVFRYLSIYPHHDNTVLQTYGGLLYLYLSYEIGSIILHVC